MRAQQPGKWLVVVGALILMAACQPTQPAPSAAAPAVAPLAMFEVPTGAESIPPTPETSSGVYLTAYINSMCMGAVRSDARCTQPYMGEFVITALNGAVVADVTTNSTGQVIVSLPPGKYILGAKTEDIYPLAAPVKINVLTDRYVHILITLDAGPRKQPAH